MRKILAKELKIKFIETMSVIVNFNYEDGNPFLIKIGTKRFFIFLKNLSPAYFKNSPDVTRVQLPYSEHFSKIFKADIPFIILGYDADNDTFVCWNPKHVKQRLNAKSNVSLYSRESLQEKVKSNEFKYGYLSNGEKIIIFKRNNLVKLFYEVSNLFKETQSSNVEIIKNNLSEPLSIYNADKLLEINDKALILQILPLLKKNKVLEAVEVCTHFYMGKYKSMTFKDWFKLVDKQYQKINKQI